MSIKRLTVGLSGLILALILISNCEKMNGPEPFLCKRLPNNQLLMMDAAQAPVGPAIPLESLDRLIILDEGVFVLPLDGEPSGASIDMIGKIIFQ